MCECRTEEISTLRLWAVTRTTWCEGREGRNWRRRSNKITSEYHLFYSFSLSISLSTCGLENGLNWTLRTRTHLSHKQQLNHPHWLGMNETVWIRIRCRSQGSESRPSHDQPVDGILCGIPPSIPRGRRSRIARNHQFLSIRWVWIFWHQWDAPWGGERVHLWGTV